MITDIEISTDQTRLDMALIHQFLSQSYWAEGRPMAVVEKSIRYSLCFGAYSADQQVGFARVITDRAVFAYLADIFVVQEYRSIGIARRMLEAILEHPDTRDVRLFRLGTRDAHGLYERFGFKAVVADGRSMELFLDAGE